MIVMALLGATIGAVLLWILSVLVPVKDSPLVMLGRFDIRDSYPDPAAGPHPRPRGAGVGWAWGDVQGRVGALIALQLQRRGVQYASLRQDLALTGRSFEAVLGRKIAGFAAGFLLVTLTAAALRATGASIGASTGGGAGGALLVAVLVGGGFFFIPDLEARREAAARRRDFRRALSAYLDLVALEMAGSAAPTEALPNAARIGSGWPLALIRDTLFRATLAGRDQFEALTDLGTRIGVSELRDLGNLVQLAGRDGARVRQTLTARAASLRRRDLADTEGEAGERDQSMLMAQVLIGFGFIVFLGFPAVVNLLAL